MAKKLYLLAVLLLGAVSALFGLREIQKFEVTVGQPGNAPAVSAHSLDSQVLFLFVHPMCSCTRATLSELQSVLEEAGHSTQVRVFFERESEGTPELWDAAAALPHSKVAWDYGGREAKRFGARTSGSLLLYRRGKLVFEGGITEARGHAGANAATQALTDALRNSEAAYRRFPVLGCALQGERS